MRQPTDCHCDIAQVIASWTRLATTVLAPGLVNTRGSVEAPPVNAFAFNTLFG